MSGNDHGIGTGFGTDLRKHAGASALQGRVLQRSRERKAVVASAVSAQGYEGLVPLDSTIAPRLTETSAMAEESVAPPSAFWAGRLELDMDLCATSPVVKGTRVTVRRVVSMVVDGWSWAEILRVQPDLTVADIRACLAYCVEEENAGSFDTVGDDDV